MRKGGCRNPVLHIPKNREIAHILHETFIYILIRV